MKKMYSKHIGMLSFAASMLLIMAACSHHAVANNSAAWRVPSLEPEYRIQPGDLLDIKFYYSFGLCPGDKAARQVKSSPVGRVSMAMVYKFRQLKSVPPWQLRGAA